MHPILVPCCQLRDASRRRAAISDLAVGESDRQHTNEVLKSWFCHEWLGPDSTHQSFYVFAGSCRWHLHSWRSEQHSEAPCSRLSIEVETPVSQYLPLSDLSEPKSKAAICPTNCAEPHPWDSPQDIGNKHCLTLYGGLTIVIDRTRRGTSPLIKKTFIHIQPSSETFH